MRSKIIAEGGLSMAIYHYSIKLIKRSEGRSAVAAAAYRSGEKLINEWDGMTHDYTKKGGVVHTEIMLPSHVPLNFSDRSTLWNSVEENEKFSNAQLAREIEIALPVELARQEQISLVRAYVRDNFVAAGMCADFAVHDKDNGNPHAHIMLTMRPLKENGEWGTKCRKEYDLDERGQRIRLPSGAFKSHRVNTTDWNDKEKSEQWRSSWAEYANRALEQKGLTERIDHRSYARQGVEQIPTVHMGVAATQMERRGFSTEKGSVNREIVAQNKLLKEIKARITRLYNWSKEQAKRPDEKRSVLEQLRQVQNAAKPTTTYGKVKALKENAAIFNFLMENGIASMQELYEKISAMNSDYYALRGEIVSAERQIAKLNGHLSMWEQYSENKAVHKRLSSIKPGMRDAFTEKHRAELILFDAAAKYFDALKASGEIITPKKWRAEVEHLTAHKDELYQKMKSMREDIKAVEKIRRTAHTLSKAEKSKEKEQHEI
jgi:outer membrane murein-binding lipoprotein Lpp